MCNNVFQLSEQRYLEILKALPLEVGPITPKLDALERFKGGLPGFSRETHLDQDKEKPKIPVHGG